MPDRARGAPAADGVSGLFGYLGYDMIRQVERLPDANPDALGVPDGMLLRPTVVCIFDTIAATASPSVTPVWPEPGLGAARRL